MKIGAHPLVVAVALGLLAPGALADEEEDVNVETKRSVHHQLDEPVDRLMAEAQPVSADDYARVAAEWHEARDLI